MSARPKFYIGVEADGWCKLFMGKPIECSGDGYPARLKFYSWGGEDVKYSWGLGYFAEKFNLSPGQYCEVVLGEVWKTDLAIETS